MSQTLQVEGAMSCPFHLARLAGIGIRKACARFCLPQTPLRFLQAKLIYVRPKNVWSAASASQCNTVRQPAWLDPRYAIKPPCSLNENVGAAALGSFDRSAPMQPMSVHSGRPEPIGTPRKVTRL